jgi:hypothetical protein
VARWGHGVGDGGMAGTVVPRRPRAV